MSYPYITGFEDFIKDLKQNGVKCAVVTMGSMEQTLAQGLDGLKEKYEEMLSTMNTTVETIRANRKELPKAEDVIISAVSAGAALMIMIIFIRVV